MESLMKPSERKALSEALLRTHGIPYNPGLPCIESEDETALRTAEELGIRMFCLFCVIGTAYHWEDLEYRQFLKKSGLWQHLSPEELAFMSSHIPDRQTAIDLTWRCEALFLIMWAARLFETLPLPINQTINEDMISKFPSFKRNPWPFIQSLQMRPKSELLDASDFLYRLHWATRQAFVEGQDPPAGLDPRIVCQWHYAINWITKYDDVEWDDVPTDT